MISQKEGPATAATMATVALSEMKRHAYSMEPTTGVVAAGGGLWHADTASGALGNMFFGNVAERVVRKASCPVVVPQR